MNPSVEFRDLVSRSRRLVDAALLLVIAIGALIVSGCILFCVLFTLPARCVRLSSDRLIEKYDPKRAEAFHVLGA